MWKQDSTFLALSLIAAAAIGTNAAGLAPAQQRPIEDFLDMQGTFCLPDGMGGCFLFVPPVENFVGLSDPALGLFASIDYAGLADQWIRNETGGEVSFSTGFSGAVTEIPLPDGRAEVFVRLHTTNALTWAIEGDDLTGAPTIFGNRAPDVLEGADAALGNSLLRVKFINTAPGAPLPDLLQLLFLPEPEQETLFLTVVATAEGPLPPDDTLGCLHTTQVGLFMTNFQGAVADVFPVEFIEITEGPCEE
ncbi:MAG: hypothetical protein ACYSUF_00700 [Planctomycetota bacterium]|jgi:hypothetical protein